MEEKGTETKINGPKQNLNLMAIDELYYKIKVQQKNNRCKSAIINNNKRKINNNKQIFNNDLISNGKDNSIELPKFSPQNSTILNQKNKTINLNQLLKINDSKGLNSTKNSTRRIGIFSGRTNSSIMNRTKILDNKKKNLNKKNFLYKLIKK